MAKRDSGNGDLRVVTARKLRLRRSVLGLALVLVAIGVACSTPPESATPSASENEPAQKPQSSRITLAPVAGAYTHRGVDTGRVDAAKVLEGAQLIYQLSPSQLADRAALLAAQQDPTSPSYHRWLTPDEYGARFGRTPSELAAASAWLVSQGLTVQRTSRSAQRIFFTGSVGQIESAFQTELHHYVVDGETHFAMAFAPSVPRLLGEQVSGVSGLSDFRPKPPHHPTQPLPEFTNASGAHFLSPADFATIYDINPLFAQTPSINGTGLSIAIVGQTFYPLSDITSFRTTLVPGVAENLVNIQVPGSGNGAAFSAADLPEAELDIEWSGAIAQKATINFVYTGQGTALNVLDAMTYAIDNDVAPIVSASYGACEPLLVEFAAAELASLEDVANQASLQGITLIAATGDDGAGACDHNVSVATQGIAVQVPSSFPQVTGVGGTELAEGSDPSLYWSALNGTTSFGGLESALSYVPETSWDDLPNGSSITLIGASTGGASILFPKPFWQAGTGVPADGKRDVPDVSLTSSGAHDPYIVYLTQIGQAPDGGNLSGFYGIGGTSAAAPSFAGMLALVEQAMSNQGDLPDAGSKGVGLGNINPTLYSMAVGAPNVFHDVTTGSNIVPCKPGTTNCPGSAPFQYGFSAGVGYDQVTGLGSFDANNLVTAFLSLGPTATTLVASPTSAVSGTNIALTATVKSKKASPDMHGFVTFYDGVTQLSDVTVSPGIVAGEEDGTAVLDVSTFTVGAHDISAVFSGDTHYLGSFTSTPTVVTITVPIPDAGLDSGGAVDASVPKDSGAPVDAGGPKDSGASVDASPPKDSGAPVDAGGPKDSGVPVDAGGPKDGGAPIDAGSSVDASAPKDSGAPIDASAPKDGGAPIDASAPKDSGAPIDASAPKDSGAPIDAGSPVDASPPIDAGGASDASAPKDSGAPIDASAPKDSGVPIDASAPKDSGAPIDGGAKDGGTAIDAGHDAGSLLDGGSGGPSDGGADAGSNLDSGGITGDSGNGSDSGEGGDDSGSSGDDSGADAGSSGDDSGSVTSGDDSGSATTGDDSGSVTSSDDGGSSTNGNPDAAADGSATLPIGSTGESSGCGCVVAGGGETNDPGVGALGGVLFGVAALARRRRSRSAR